MQWLNIPNGQNSKFIVFCTLLKQKAFGPFTFAEHSVSGVVYLDKLHEFLIPILIEGHNDMLLQQDRVPYLSVLSVPSYLHLGISGCQCPYFVSWISLMYTNKFLPLNNMNKLLKLFSPLIATNNQMISHTKPTWHWRLRTTNGWLRRFSVMRLASPTPIPIYLGMAASVNMEE
jgi:hypothetical protein